MDAGRIAGTVTLGLLLGAAWALGAPASMVVSIAVLAVVITATTLLPGIGARAFSNLAGRLYDRATWEQRWDERGAAGDEGPSGEPTLPPGLLPDDLEDSKAWLRTLAEIRTLPEDAAGDAHGRRRDRRSRSG